MSMEGKGSVDAAGKLSSDMKDKHISIGKVPMKLIEDFVKRYSE
jgi:hypothetical protein